MRTPRRRADRGSASLELIGLVPVVLGVAMLVLQAGAAAYTLNATAEAARTAARAASLGADGPAVVVAARTSLPAGLTLVSATLLPGAGHDVQVSVLVPRVSVLPQFTVTREVVMP